MFVGRIAGAGHAPRCLEPSRAAPRVAPIGTLLRAAACLAALWASGCTQTDAVCRGTRLDLAEGGYCVLDPDAGTTRCPDGYWFQREVGGAIVCGRERVRPESLPPEVCALLPDGCPLGPADSGVAELDGAPMDAGARDAGPEASSGRDAEACDRRTPPERPSGEDDGTGEVRWYALREVEVGRGLRWIDLGYDLDGRCTTSTSDDLECTVDPAVGAIPDPAQGVDNTFGSRLTPLLALAAPDLESQVRMRLEAGEEGVLLRVAGWNGRSDDPRVSVGVLAAPAGGGAGSDLGDGGVRTRLALDGTDLWAASASSVEDGDPQRPRVEDPAGYVAGGTLVARFPTGVVLRFTVGSERVRLDGGIDAGFPGGRAPLVLTIRLRLAILTARPSVDGVHLEDGILAGRWAMGDVLGMLPALAVCDPDGGPYRLAESEFRRALDLTSDGTTRRDDRCEALSVGLGVAAVAAQLGGVVPSDEPFDHCALR